MIIYLNRCLQGEEIPQVQLSVMASPELGPKAVIINTADNLSTGKDFTKN